MTLSNRYDVLVAGAGPTGLAAALFLAERGIRARVIDKSEGPSTTSRAQVVNPRSLELLDRTGVTEAILAHSHPIQSVRFYEDWRPLAEIGFAHIPSRFPMSVIPQAKTEALLAAALEPHGVQVERATTCEFRSQSDSDVTAALTHGDGTHEEVRVLLLLAADGAHSGVREALGLGFEGHAFPEAWPLYDMHLADPLPLNHAHVSFVKGGLVFMLCIHPGLWRVFGNIDNLLELLPEGSRPGAVEWQSSFHIADRVATTIAEKRVALAGDAAHIHSPVGARGMNLGIEDAYVYAACAAGALAGRRDAIDNYAGLRQPIHKTVVGRMDYLTTLARGRPDWVGLMRHYLFPTIAGFGPVTRLMQNFLTGLDHPVEIS